MKFLVVDDSKPMRLVMKNLLHQIDRTAEVVEAADGHEALDLIEGSYDLVLLDYNMPGKDGISFIREFRKKNKVTPVIMVTGEAERAKVINAFRAGVTDYVVRPSPPELIKERIEIALRGEDEDAAEGAADGGTATDGEEAAATSADLDGNDVPENVETEAQSDAA